MTIPVVDEHRLVALIHDPATMKQAWVRRAACLEQAIDTDEYFPDDHGLPSAAALGCCASCPVRGECLATALVHEATDGYRFGWWGGLGPDHRQELSSRIDVPGQLRSKIGTGDPGALARHLRAQRYSISAIASQLGCSERAVYRYLAATAA